VGGHNLWTQHYLDVNPVHDLSMKVRGGAAASAQRFANELWDWTCNNVTALTKLTWSVTVSRLADGRVTTACPARFDLAPPAGAATGSVIAVGRLGTGIVKDGNQADDAQLAMIDAAKSTVRMSLQDIGPVKAPYLGIPLGSWPDALLTSLGSALNRGVDVYLVLSNDGSRAGGLTATEAPYSNGWTVADVARTLRDHMGKRAGFPRGAALDALVCKRLHAAPFRYSADDTWTDGVPFASHSKTLAIDEQAFYIGSQNLYPAGLQELGYIVDDSVATRAYLTGYWANVWRFSGARAVTGPEAARCALQ
jgi:phosphatidylserine/phosphatidylglycerophosphate/cardiolipin synthase-like enzyme